MLAELNSFKKHKKQDNNTGESREGITDAVR